MHTARMRWMALIALVCVAAGPATSPPAARSPQPASKPTAEPARVDQAFVDNFVAGILNSPYEEVVAKLRAMGALREEPKKLPSSDQSIYNVKLGYSWEYSEFDLYTDAKGLVRKYIFMVHPFGPGPEEPSQPPKDRILEPGNRWYLGFARLGTSNDPKNPMAAEQVYITRVQAKSPAAAEQAVKARLDKMLPFRITTAYGGKKPEKPFYAGIEVHDWSDHRLRALTAERPD